MSDKEKIERKIAEIHVQIMEDEMHEKMRVIE